jgi:ABC-type transport system substrate-binding protein
MKRSVLFLFGFGLSVGLVACGSDTGSGLGPYGSFCGPVLAQMDSFTATFEGQEWPEERYGGMAVVGSVAPMRGFSPRAAGTVASAQHMQFVTHMTLLEFDENLEMVPYLAESWEVSEDGTQLTFHLRDDVFWHDGHPTTAEDVAFTFRTFRDPASLYSNQSFFLPYLPAGDLQSGPPPGRLHPYSPRSPRISG